MREGETSEEVSVVVFSSSPIQLFISKVNEMQKNLKKEEFLAKKQMYTRSRKILTTLIGISVSLPVASRIGNEVSQCLCEVAAFPWQRVCHVTRSE